jgi:hypothetical protein
MSDCNHEVRDLVWTTVGSDCQPLETERQLREQCRNCGRLLTQQKARRLAKPDTPNVNLPALKRWNDEREERWRAQAASYQEAREAQNAEWFARYNEYLQTPEWRAKSAAVIDREKGLCEGCRKARAVHVHHLTYSHVGRELLFQLVAVCLECHEHAHERKL